MKDPFIIYTNSSPKTKNRTLDWEESALDAQDSETEIFDSERLTYFLTWLWPLVILIFFTIFSRLFFLQILKGESYRQVAENNRIRKQVILAPRGLIVDSLGKL
jgi:hypothetical protein